MGSSGPTNDSAGCDGQSHLTDLARCWLGAQPAIASYVTASVWNKQDAEDIVQQVAEVCATKFDQYDKQRPFLKWALGIARNEVLRYCRQQDKSKLVFSPATLDLVAEEIADREPDLEDRSSALRECIKKVVGRPRQLLEMRYYREMKAAEIGDRLGLSSEAVRVALWRVRQELGTCISQSLRRCEK